MARLAELTMGGLPILGPVAGTPSGSTPAFCLTSTAISSLEEAYRRHGRERPQPPRGGVARSYAQHRGRISTTELASIVDAAPSNVGTHLKELESDGVLIPSSPTRAGRGFHYIWAEASR